MISTIDDFDLGSVEEMYTPEIAAEIAYLYDYPTASARILSNKAVTKKKPKPAALLSSNASHEYSLCGVKINYIDTDTENDFSITKNDYAVNSVIE